MISLALRRLLEAIPALIVISIIMFALMQLSPDPLVSLKQNPNVTEKDVARIAELNGWDMPPVQQYVHWAKGFVTGDLGTSWLSNRGTGELIMDRLPLTLMLTGMSLIVSLLIALPIGAYVAVHKYSKADYAATLTTFAMMAAPSFFVGLLLQLMAIRLQDMFGGTLVFYTAGPPRCASFGFASVFHCLGTPIEAFQRLALPVTALSVIQVAGWSRYMRSELLGVLNADYIRSAMAKGLDGKVIFFRHALRNALLPLVTIIALDVAGLFGGAVITEQVFGLPGMGNLLLSSLNNADISVVLAIVMIGAAITLIMNLVADILYGVLDPRVRVG